MNRSLGVAAIVAATVALSACTTAPPEEAVDQPGLTDSTITLGVLTDLSGPFAAANRVTIPAFEAFWDARNAAGGVCGRQVDLDIRDHGYDPQKAVTLYRSMEPEVFAIQQLLGSPMVPAVMPLAEEDGLYVGGVGLTAGALTYEAAQLPGATYSLEGANAVDFLADELDVEEGSTIGVIYFSGELGADALSGIQHAAGERGLQISSQEIAPSVTDLTAQVTALRDAGVSAVVLAAASPQLASIAGVLPAVGLDVPIVTLSVAFNPSVLGTASAETLLDNGYTVLSFAPYSADGEGMETMRAVYEEALPDAPVGWDVSIAYGEVELLAAALEEACADGDPTREGVIEAFRSQTELDLGGVYATPLDYGTVGEPPLRSVFVAKMDADVDGGLRVLDVVEGPSAQSYTFE